VSRLHDLIEMLEPDAREALQTIAERMVAGRRQYGRLEIATDDRDFRQEFAEEMLDGAVYAAIETIRQRRKA